AGGIAGRVGEPVGYIIDRCRKVTMNPMNELQSLATRRYFLQRSGFSLGAVALSWLLNKDAQAAAQGGGLEGLPHFAARAKRVIYLFQSGAPSQMDLFDYKPR